MRTGEVEGSFSIVWNFLRNRLCVNKSDLSFSFNWCRLWICKRVNCPDSQFFFRRVEYVFVGNVCRDFVRVKQCNVSLFVCINEIFDHAAKWRHADTTGDEDEFFVWIFRKYEVACEL